jgi:hypothetical protein
MRWKRILAIFALSGAVMLTALRVVPGATVASLLAQAGYLLLLPWLVALVSFPVGTLARGLVDAFRRAPLRGETSARVLRSLGGLTWVAGLLGLWASFHVGQMSLFTTASSARGRVDFAGAMPGIIAAMCVPVALALVFRLTFYDPLARAVEAAAGLDGGAAANQSAQDIP